MTSKGQVTIPQDVRKQLGLGQGDQVDFVDLGNNQICIVAVVEEVTILKGVVRKPFKPIPVVAMNEVIAKQGAKG
jgi:AbrB family looped-hinge helix DNA binding protein